MCDSVNLSYVRKTMEYLGRAGSVLEIGSYDVNGSCRNLFSMVGWDYIGVDVREGPGVDRLCDITHPLDDVQAVVGGPFDAIVCMNVLEHLWNPTLAIKNMVSLARKGGHILIVTPLVWDFHDYPADYFRFCPDYYRRCATEFGLRIIDDVFAIASRDTERYYDPAVLPQIVPQMRGCLVAKLFWKALGWMLPEARESWSRLYLNILYERL